MQLAKSCPGALMFKRVVRLAITTAVCSTGQAWATAAVGVDELFDLDVNQLMQVQVDSAATMTPTSERLMPASVTTLDRTLIRQSGARNLFDLLEIHVPNFHYLPHHYEAPHMGMRGIIGDRDDKYLIVVNGRVINERTHYGALSERDLPLMADIRRIDVIRGPGSVIYGPGAVSMVINIQTDSYSDHGSDGASLAMGGGERFQALELEKALAIGDHGGLLLYGGISNYDGAQADDAHLVYGLSGTTTWGQQVNAGEPVPFYVFDNHGAARGQPKIKLHADFEQGDFRAWVRYSRGGEQLSWEHKVFYEQPNGFAEPGTAYTDLVGQSVAYQQLVMDLSQRWIVSDDLWLELKGGYDTIDYERTLFNNSADRPIESHREEQYFARSTLNWRASKAQSMAAGIEYGYYRWGLDSPGYPDTPAVSFTLGEMDPWHTYSYGVFAEHQWQLAARWTNFLGLRFDQDEYTDPMWSPRWALVYTPSEQDTVKAIISRSVRKNNAEELRKQHLADQTSEPEILNSAELIHERRWSPNVTTALSGFYSDVEVIGIDTVDLRSKRVADFHYGGLELTAAWSNDQFDLSGSHAWTKLDDFTQAPGASQKISVAHLGYGNELSNWSDNITKLVLGWQLAPQWRLSGSVRVFWDYEGAREVTRQTNDARAASTTGRSSSTALSDPGYDDSFEEAIFVDLGVHYQLPGSGQLAVHGYNLLGLVDERYNKRMYLINVQNYQAEATAVAIIYRQPF